MGAYPQVKEVIYTCDVNDPEFVDNFFIEKIPIKPKVANPVLYLNAKRTDLINIWDTGFSFTKLISGKLKDILMSYRTEGMQFFQCSVFQNGIEYVDFYLWKAYKFEFEFIDFDKSEVYLMNISKKIEKLPIRNYNEFMTKKQEVDNLGFPFGLMVEKIHFQHDLPEDVFSLRYVEGGMKYFVSQKLKSDIEQSGCTGIEFQPIELSITEWLQGGEREKVYGKA